MIDEFTYCFKTKYEDITNEQNLFYKFIMPETHIYICSSVILFLNIIRVLHIKKANIDLQFYKNSIKLLERNLHHILSIFKNRYFFLL